MRFFRIVPRETKPVRYLFYGSGRSTRLPINYMRFTALCHGKSTTAPEKNKSNVYGRKMACKFVACQIVLAVPVNPLQKKAAERLSNG